MNDDLLTIEPEISLREAAQRMSERNAGAAVVIDTVSGGGPGIITERDMLDSIAAGHDPDQKRVDDSSTTDAVTVSVDTSLEQAVQKMEEGNFRHLLVVHGEELVGIVSMRDLVRALTS